MHRVFVISLQTNWFQLGLASPSHALSAAAAVARHPHHHQQRTSTSYKMSIQGMMKQATTGVAIIPPMHTGPPHTTQAIRSSTPPSPIISNNLSEIFQLHLLSSRACARDSSNCRLARRRRSHPRSLCHSHCIHTLPHMQRQLGHRCASFTNCMHRRLRRLVECLP